MDLEQASAKIFEFLDSKLEGLDAMGVLLATEQDPNDYTIDKNTPKKKKKRLLMAAAEFHGLYDSSHSPQCLFGVGFWKKESFFRLRFALLAWIVWSVNCQIRILQHPW